jgi:hypothetical protein
MREKQYNQYYHCGNGRDQVQTSADSQTYAGYCPYTSGCGQSLNNTSLPVQNSPGTKEANASHYASGNSGWIGFTKAINRGYGKKGSAKTNEGMGSQAGRLASSLSLVANNSSQGCCQQQAQNHFKLNCHPSTP